MSELWSWALSALGITGLFFIGQRRWYGFAIGAANESLWLVYAITTQQYGFIIGAVAYGALHIRNMRKWRKT